MAKASIVKQITVTTEDKAGMLAEVSKVIGGTGVNIDAVCAYAMDGKAIFMIVTSDSAKASAALEGKGYKVKEGDVVIADLDNKVGAAAGMGEKLKKAGINLNYIMGSTCASCDCPCRIVLSSDDNAKAVKVLGG